MSDYDFIWFEQCKSTPCGRCHPNSCQMAYLFKSQKEFNKIKDKVYQETLKKTGNVAEAVIERQTIEKFVLSKKNQRANAIKDEAERKAKAEKSRLAEEAKNMREEADSYDKRTPYSKKPRRMGAFYSSHPWYRDRW